MEIELREPRTDEEFERYYDLRWRILREPWTLSRESGRDEYEAGAFHLTAWAGGKLVGAGRLHFLSPVEAQIRYMAVEQGHTGQGIGSLILQGLEEHALESGVRSIVLNARDTALPFYQKHRYQLVDQSGTLFHSIVHWRMRKDL